MGLFDWMMGNEPPAASGWRPAAEARDALLAINRDTAPFRVRDGAPEGVDLVAEWKIVDAQWYEIFAKAGIKRAFTVLMRLDEAKGEIRTTDQQYLVGWRAGVPETSFKVSVTRGRQWELSTETAYAFREDLSFGKVYRYNFSTASSRRRSSTRRGRSAGAGVRSCSAGCDRHWKRNSRKCENRLKSGLKNLIGVPIACASP